MGKRQALKINTELLLKNNSGGTMRFVVGKVIGFGGSCIVYDGYYMNNAGTKSTVRIKECFPHKLHLHRTETGALIVKDTEAEQFHAYKTRMRKSFGTAQLLHEMSGLTNYTAHVFDIYEANDTVYIISSYAEGSVLSNAEFTSLDQALRVVISTSKRIEQIHKQGYLYLDIKPENILIDQEMPELIRLFDFDAMIPIGTKETITEYKLACSPGFAPMEQKIGDMKHIGKHTDIYSIGALLFYLLFGRVPGAADCGFETEYDYSKLKWQVIYQQKLYKALDVFFHHTLQAYYKDRYSEMTEVLEGLAKIEQYAQIPSMICPGYGRNNSQVVGRNAVCQKILGWYESREKLIFITGMGGIGKSTVVKKFISDYSEQFDNVLFLQFKNTISETITDDLQLCVRGCEKDKEETTEEYFFRKMKVVCELTSETEVLLVIDNFDGIIDEAFSQLLKVHWKIIAVTRSDMHSSGFPFQKIESLDKKEDLYELFENCLGRKMETDEFYKFDRIAEIAEDHTLILVLIARQIARSFLTIDEALELVQMKGFSEMAPEKVDYMQDGIRKYEKVSAIIRAVYDVSVLTEEKKKCLKFFSLFDQIETDIKQAGKLLALETFDIVNELADSGWIEINGRNVRMHPLIQETMHHVCWTDEYRHIALAEMDLLTLEITVGEENSRAISSTPDYKKLRQSLFTAKTVLKNCSGDAAIKHEKRCRELMTAVLLNTPKDEETLIVSSAEQILSDCSDMDLYRVIDVYDYLIYVLCQKEYFEEAQKYLDRARQYALACESHYVRGKYYDMLADYYDTILDGSYDSQDEVSEALINAMFLASDRAIRHMHQSKHKEAKRLLVKYHLDKAALLIRSGPERRAEIEKLILNAQKLMERYHLDDSVIHVMDCMVCAWYYTLCDENEDAVSACLCEAETINECRNISDLDKIDDFYIPAANMMCELALDDRADHYLSKACSLCENHSEEAPYICKKSDLLSYKKEIEDYTKSVYCQ